MLNKSDVINNLNNKYKSILEEYSIESDKLNSFNVTNYEYIRDISRIIYDKNNDEQKKDVYENGGSEYIYIYLQNNANDTIKINHWFYLECGEESTDVYYNDETIMDCSYGSYSGYGDGERLYKDILKRLGIALYNDKLTSKNSYGIIYKIQSKLLEYFNKNKKNIEAVYKEYNSDLYSNLDSDSEN